MNVTNGSRRGWRAWLLLFLGLAVVGTSAIGVYRQTRWKRFAVVQPGVLYRSGELSESQLRSAIKSLKLKTVICLEGDHVAREERVCHHLGINFVPLPMPSDGLGERDQFAEFLRIANDPKSYPILVHCQAGVARTGAAVALYRVRNDGWSVDQALKELRTFERQGRLEPKLAAHVSALADSFAPRTADQSTKSYR